MNCAVRRRDTEEQGGSENVHRTDSQIGRLKQAIGGKVLQKVEKTESTQGVTVTGAEGKGHILVCMLI